MKYLFPIILAYLSVTPLFAQKLKTKLPEKVTNVEFGTEKGTLSNMYKECTGADFGNVGLLVVWQEQLGDVKKECGFKYVKIRPLLIDNKVGIG